MRYYGVALAILLLDQITKWLVLNRMELYESIPVVDGIFYITSHRNRERPSAFCRISCGCLSP